MFKRLRHNVAMFQAPMISCVLLGSLICYGYYAVLKLNPDRLALLYRYSTCHEVAYVTVELFFIATCTLVYKLLEVLKQQKLQRLNTAAVDEIKLARSDEEFDGEMQQLLWLEAAWKSQTRALYSSWFGQRIRDFLYSQMLRKSLEQSDETQNKLAERDANLQHDSFALLRIFAWAMPMLGFLGTVLGLSTTLGQMDAAALASGSQEAMNEITQGLYVAFDTTAIGLVLTMVVIFGQYVISKLEVNVLQKIDSLTEDLLGHTLVPQANKHDFSKVDSAVEAVTASVLKSVEKLVEKQSALWQSALEKSQERWQLATNGTNEAVQQSLLPAISQAISNLVSPLHEHQEKIAKLHSEGATLVDHRVQQWQVTISDQARAMVEQQAEMRKQSDLLRELIEKADLVKSMEAPIQSTLQRLTDVDRFHDAAVCLAEAIAVLGTQMERYGYLGRQPVRRSTNTDEKEAIDQPNVSTEDTPISIPFPRKAG